MKKMRKKGNVILLGGITMILLFILAAILINIFVIWEVSNHSMRAADSAAQTRALAVDIPLKEAYGYIEIMHPPSMPFGPYNDNLDHDSLAQNAPPGNTPPLTPEDPAYQANVRNIEESAKEAAINFINTTSGSNVNGEPLITVTPGDICFDIEPLPTTGGNNQITFSCKFDPSSDTTINTATVTQTVSYADQGINNFSIFKDRTDSNAPKVQIENVAFVAIRVKYHLFIDTALKNLGLETTDARYRTVYAIAYPQIDKCSKYDPAYKCGPLTSNSNVSSN